MSNIAKALQVGVENAPAKPVEATPTAPKSEAATLREKFSARFAGLFGGDKLAKGQDALVEQPKVQVPEKQPVEAAKTGSIVPPPPSPAERPAVVAHRDGFTGDIRQQESVDAGHHGYSRIGEDGRPLPRSAGTVDPDGERQGGKKSSEDENLIVIHPPKTPGGPQIVERPKRPLPHYLKLVLGHHPCDYVPVSHWGDPKKTFARFVTPGPHHVGPDGRIRPGAAAIGANCTSFGRPIRVLSPPFNLRDPDAETDIWDDAVQTLRLQLMYALMNGARGRLPTASERAALGDESENA